MVLFPIAAGTVYAPPLILVPAGAVVRERTWQTAHPILLNRSEPRSAAGVFARTASGGGAFDDRMNRAKRSTSASPSGPGLSLGSAAALQMVVTSSGNNDVVIPISFKYASPENESRLACWFFHPNRPTPA